MNNEYFKRGREFWWVSNFRGKASRKFPIVKHFNWVLFNQQYYHGHPNHVQIQTRGFIAILLTCESSDNLGGFHSLPLYPKSQLIGSLSHYLQGFIHPRWLTGISSINSIPGWGTLQLFPSGLPHHPTLGLATASIMETWDVHRSGWCHLTCHGDWQQRTSLDLNVSLRGRQKTRWFEHVIILGSIYIVTCWYHMCMRVLFKFHQISMKTW